MGIGAEKASQVSNTSEAASVTLTCLVLAVVASGVAGGTSAVLGVALRDALNKRVLPMTITFLVPFSGAITLGPTLLTRFGATTLANTPMEQWWLMFGAGAFNFIGFLSFVTGLQRTTVAYANVVSASQVAIASVAGMLLFHELPNAWLILGICLTIVGILGFDRPDDGNKP